MLRLISGNLFLIVHIYKKSSVVKNKNRPFFKREGESVWYLNSFRIWFKNHFMGLYDLQNI